MSGRKARVFVVTAMAALVWSEMATLAPLPVRADPRLVLDRTIRTTPFKRSRISMHDSEAAAFVPRDNSLWLADDNAGMIYEVNPDTGRLKRRIGRTAFASVRRFGGGPKAGQVRTHDFEALAYDARHDNLYLFSGPCCKASTRAAVFRLARNRRGRLKVASYQPLPKTANYTAAAWDPADRRLYVGVIKGIRAYNYNTNRSGRLLRVRNLVGPTGMDFSSDGDDLWVTTEAETLRRVRWGKRRRLVPGWTFDLSRFNVRDSRAVELIGRQFFVVDGDDARPPGPLKHAVFVFHVRR